MKRESSRSGSQSKSAQSRHRFEHQVPTKIHDPEEDMMVLARWTHRAMKKPTRFWGTIAGVVAGLLALVLLSNMLLTGSSGNTEVWSRVETAKSPADRLKIADDFPSSPASVWARLEAATEYYDTGFRDLPNNKDVALPNLKKALDNFEEVARDAPKDSPQAKAAALGKARTLEARNELAKAIEQYQLVEKTWPGSPEATQAKRLAAELKKPEAATFYKDLYAYLPTKVTLPPLGTSNLDMPLIPSPGTGSLRGPAEAMPGGLPSSIPLLPPPPPSPVSKGPATPSAGNDAGKTAKQAPPNQQAPVLPESPFDSDTATPGTKPATPAPSASSPKQAPPAKKSKS
jgi:hypothetical protein